MQCGHFITTFVYYPRLDSIFIIKGHLSILCLFIFQFQDIFATLCQTSCDVLNLRERVLSKQQPAKKKCVHRADAELLTFPS